MPVYDQSYKRWEGSFKSHAFRWWVISKYGIKTAFKRKAVKGLFVFALAPLVASAIYIYGLTHLGKVSAFVQGLGGGMAMPEFSGKIYEVEIEGDTKPFLDKLEEEGLASQMKGRRFTISLPEGENSKKIFAIARQSGTKISRLVPPGVKASFYNGYLKRMFIFLFILLLVVGSGLIAKDVKLNALPIYLAKPITEMEYILGKLGIPVFFLVMVTMVPAIFLFLFQAILIGDSLYLRHYFWVLGAISAYSLLMIFSGTLIVLALSAFSRNVRSAAFGAAAFFWFSPMIAEVLRTSTWNDNYRLISLPHNWTRLGEEIFGLTATTDVRWEWSLLIVLGIMVLCAVGLVRRVRAVEVVK
ncbi:ABC transporter permease subunit [bacterium]|nr:ABC transporter permease subunit [bacterium]